MSEILVVNESCFMYHFKAYAGNKLKEVVEDFTGEHWIVGNSAIALCKYLSCSIMNILTKKKSVCCGREGMKYVIVCMWIIVPFSLSFKLPCFMLFNHIVSEISHEAS